MSDRYVVGLRSEPQVMITVGNYIVRPSDLLQEAFPHH